MRDLIKRIAVFFSGKNSNNDLNSKICSHINLFCDIKRLDAGIGEIEITEAPVDMYYIIVDVYCSNPGKLIGIKGRTATKIAGELSLLTDCIVEFNALPLKPVA